MKRALDITALALLLVFASGCDSLPGKPAPGPEVPRPDSILDPATLYKENCAGCHGATGRGAVATPQPRRVRDTRETWPEALVRYGKRHIRQVFRAENLEDNQTALTVVLLLESTSPSELRRVF